MKKIFLGILLLPMMMVWNVASAQVQTIKQWENSVRQTIKEAIASEKSIPPISFGAPTVKTDNEGVATFTYDIQGMGEEGCCAFFVRANPDGSGVRTAIMYARMNGQNGAQGAIGAYAVLNSFEPRPDRMDNLKLVMSLIKSQGGMQTVGKSTYKLELNQEKKTLTAIVVYGVIDK